MKKKTIKLHAGITANITVVVEEPELNLHPALQGELAKFFHDVNKEYGIELAYQPFGATKAPIEPIIEGGDEDA